MNLLNRGPDFCQVSPDQTNTKDSEIRKEVFFFTGLQYFAISDNVLTICPISTVYVKDNSEESRTARTHSGLFYYLHL